MHAPAEEQTDSSKVADFSHFPYLGSSVGVRGRRCDAEFVVVDSRPFYAPGCMVLVIHDVCFCCARPQWPSALSRVVREVLSQLALVCALAGFMQL